MPPAAEVGSRRPAASGHCIAVAEKKRPLRVLPTFANPVPIGQVAAFPDLPALGPRTRRFDPERTFAPGKCGGPCPHRPYRHGNVAGDENGLVASATNMTRAVRSLLPPLDTCIGVPGGCPSID